MKKLFFCLMMIPLIIACSSHDKPNLVGYYPYQDMAEMGCWFWKSSEFAPEGYKPFIDLVARHSNYKHLTTSIRAPLVEVTDESVWLQIKKAAEYAQTKDIGLIFDLDVRLARYAFWKKYPNEIQELLLLKEIELPQSGDARIHINSIDLGDHYTYQTVRYIPLSGRFVRAFAYKIRDSKIDSNSLKKKEIIQGC